jgi:hypothetical protein
MPVGAKQRCCQQDATQQEQPADLPAAVRSGAFLLILMLDHLSSSGLML